MKNNKLHPLLLTTIIFTALLIGFFTGRISTIYSNTTVSARSESVNVDASKDHVLPAENKININTATFDDLMLLPGIGPALAERIISYRETNGPFTSKEELVNVNGIGNKTYAKLENYITTGG